jgi:hypothetical protein
MQEHDLRALPGSSAKRFFQQGEEFIDEGRRHGINAGEVQSDLLRSSVSEKCLPDGCGRSSRDQSPLM